MKSLEKIIKRKTMSPILIKIGSLLVAVILWFYVIYGKDTEVTFKIPIVYQNLPSHLSVAEISHEFLHVAISGRSDLVKNVVSEDFQAIIDFKDAEVGFVKKFPVQLIKINVPENINVATQKIEVSVQLENNVYK